MFTILSAKYFSFTLGTHGYFVWKYMASVNDVTPSGSNKIDYYKTTTKQNKALTCAHFLEYTAA